ncbi:MAG: glycosyltransferase, partial [Anaerolineales bacterium]
MAPRLRETWHKRRQAPWRRLPFMDVSPDGPDRCLRVYPGWVSHLWPKWAARRASQMAHRAFAEYIKSHDLPEIIHGHNCFYGGYMAVELARHYDLPLVISEHSTSFLRGWDTWPGRAKVVQWVVNGTDQMIAVSAALAERLRTQHGVVDVMVVPNVVNAARFRLAPLPSEPFTFGIVGYLKRIKRIDLFLRAFARAFPGASSTSPRAIVVGDGPQQRALHRLGERLGLASRVTFAGNVAAQDMAGVYAA